MHEDTANNFFFANGNLSSVGQWVISSDFCLLLRVYVIVYYIEFVIVSEIFNFKEHAMNQSTLCFAGV